MTDDETLANAGHPACGCLTAGMLLSRDADCVRCGDAAVGRVRYDFDQESVVYAYCQPCAEHMHQHYQIDAIVDGSLDLDGVEVASAGW